MVNKTVKFWVGIGATALGLLTLVACHAAAPAPAGRPIATSSATSAPGAVTPSATSAPGAVTPSATSAPGAVTSIPMATPGSVETAFGSVWVAEAPSAMLTRLDPRTNAVIARIPTPDPASV